MVNCLEWVAEQNMDAAQSAIGTAFPPAVLDLSGERQQLCGSLTGIGQTCHLPIEFGQRRQRTPFFYRDEHLPVQGDSVLKSRFSLCIVTQRRIDDASADKGAGHALNVLCLLVKRTRPKNPVERAVKLLPLV